MLPQSHFITLNNLQFHLRQWHPTTTPSATPYLLVHGLASNAQTWDEVATYLVQQGHPVVALDQRGHGLSDKPDTGYDFTQITDDLYQLISHLGWQKPILVGQSWGGNVLLAFGAYYPMVARQLIFVDGGFLDLQAGGSWEEVSQNLRPPNLTGIPRTTLWQQLRQFHPDWSDNGIEATLANFEMLTDGAVRPWLSLANHLQILRALYDQNPVTLYPQVTTPVLMCVAAEDPEWANRKQPRVDAALKALPHATAVWFPNTAHDIHIHRPQQLAETFLAHQH